MNTISLPRLSTGRRCVSLCWNIRCRNIRKCNKGYIRERIEALPSCLPAERSCTVGAGEEVLDFLSIMCAGLLLGAGAPCACWWGFCADR